MSDEDQPRVVDLSKQSSDEDSDSSESAADAAAEEYGDADEGEEADGGGEPYEGIRDAYPEEVDEEDDEDSQSETVYGQAREDYDFDPEEAQKAFSYNEYGLASQFDEKGFSKLEEGDLVVIDTPLHGGKCGEVTKVEDTWTGTLEATVDTGASEYTVTPFEDEYSVKFVACVNEGREVNDEMLHSLGKTTVGDVDIGTQVMLDVPNVGPTRGMVQEKKTTQEQGEQITVNTGPVAFDVYEDPSPQQKKEQPFLIGRISE